jgi:hypothetical protein
MHSTWQRNDHRSPPIRQLLSSTDELPLPAGWKSALSALCLSDGLRHPPLTCMLLKVRRSVDLNVTVRATESVGARGRRKVPEKLQ